MQEDLTFISSFWLISWTSAGFSNFWKVACVIYRCTIAYPLHSFRLFASSCKTALISDCRYVYGTCAERAARLVVYEMYTVRVSSGQDLTSAAAVATTSRTRCWKREGGKDRSDAKTKETEAATGWPKAGVLYIERGSTRSPSVENSFWKRLWTCYKTLWNKWVNEWMGGYYKKRAIFFVVNSFIRLFIHYFLILYCDRPITSSKTSSPDKF
jgi:hypothetical protein